MLWIKARVDNVEETSKSKLDFESVRTPPRPKSCTHQNRWMRTAWLLLEDEERWIQECSASLSSLTISNYLMSDSRVWKHRTSSQWTQTTNMAIVSTHSITFQPFNSLSSSRQCWKIHTCWSMMLTLVWLLALSNLFLVIAFSSVFCLSFLSLPFLYD